MTSIRAQGISLRYPLFSAAGGPVSPDGAAQMILTKGRRRFVQALRNVSFSLVTGDRLGIVGRNGSGKSTLLRVLAGILPPQEGEVVVEGQLAALLNIGHGMRVEASGERNIILRGMMAGKSRKDAEAQVARIAEYAELGDYIKLPVRTYSSGMAMRLNFAIATAFDPEILLLDEWIGAGDQAFSHKVHARMDALVAEAGIVVLASHNAAMVEQACNKALWLDRGEIAAYGETGAVLDAYLRREGGEAA